MRVALVLSWIALGTQCLLGCDARVCEAGREVECACPEGKKGVQACARDGKKFLACDCPVASADRDEHRKREEALKKVEDLSKPMPPDESRDEEIRRKLEKQIRDMQDSQGTGAGPGSSARPSPRGPGAACTCKPSDPLCDCL